MYIRKKLSAMAEHRDHHSTKRNKLQVLIVPEENGAKGLSFAAHKWQLVAGLAALMLIVAVASIAAMILTPLGRIVPVSDAELAQRYGSELVSLQERVVNLSQEMLVMRDYNRKLRIALGDNTDTDSLMMGLAEQIAIAPDRSAEAGEQADGISSGVPRTAGEKGQPGSERAAASGGAQESRIAQHGPVFRAAFPISAPVDGYITRTFQNDKMHFGVDYAGRQGTIITAAADGYVLFSDWTHEGGNIIILSHGGGYSTVYQHNQALLKQQGDFVKRGTPIALLGNSGTTSFGPHLHFEVWKDGLPQNPGDYLIASEK